ncbi:MAG: hypothetical protein ACXACI_10800 [Candidatus Hodarchaeales archaeon]
MELLLLIEWKNPIEEDRWKKLAELGQKIEKYWEPKLEAGTIKDIGTWSDNTNSFVYLLKFENGEAFAKVWNDEEFHRLASSWSSLVDCPSFRVLRPGLPMQEEE